MRSCVGSSPHANADYAATPITTPRKPRRPGDFVIYAVLSYIVARRTREIGVRVALRASARKVVTSIFKRPLIQVTLGVLAGVVLIVLATTGMQHTQEFAGMKGRGLTLGELSLLAGYAVLMLGVCMLACIVPDVRALRVQPTEALRAE